jgi:hypothetical protein
MRAYGLPALLAGLILTAPLRSSGQVVPPEPSPVPTSMPEGGAPTAPAGGQTAFDPNGARASLTAIEYKDCGSGGPTKLTITFRSDGTVEGVVLAEGALEADVAVCLTRRFMKATVTPFEGPSRAVKWSVQLPGAPAAPASTSPPPLPPPRAAYGDEIIAAGERSAPPGYHEEMQRRTGLLVAGSIVTAIGFVTALIVYSEAGESSFRSGTESLYKGLAIIHVAVGLPLFFVGLTPKRVFVPDSMRFAIAPAISRTGGSLGVALSF